MSGQHEHTHHEHGSHAHAPAVHAHGHVQGHAHGDAHAGHGVMVHAPSEDALASYRQAYDEAEPAPGRTVVRIDLDAREADWEFTSGRRTRAWTFNGQVP